MIRLNLTNAPGLQEEEILTQFDLEGLIPEQPVQEATETPAVEGVETAQPPTVPPPPPAPDIDADIFKLAEANLDLIEQAEKEEFGAIDQEQAKKLEKGEVVRRKSIRPGLRYTFYLVLVAAIIYGIWAFRQGLFSKADLKSTAQSLGQTIREEVDLVDNLAEKEELPIAEAVQPSVIQPVPEREAIQSTERLYGVSQISDDFILRVYQGQQRLRTCADVLAGFPATAQLQYIRIKNDKISFILFVADEAQAQQIKSSFLNTDRFFPPEVYFVERSNKVASNPVEIMAIVKFRILQCEDKRGYKHFSDLHLSQHVWQAGLNSKVGLDPLQISNRDPLVTRQASITGIGAAGNVVQFLSELATIRDNMEVNIISITNTFNKNILETQLNYHLDTILYPANI